MNVELSELRGRTPDARLDGIIKLAILAVGGQGGGVLTNWIEGLARAQGYAWCLWAEDNAPDPGTGAAYRARCAPATAELTADERARGAALFTGLTPLTPLAEAP